MFTKLCRALYLQLKMSFYLKKAMLALFIILTTYCIVIFAFPSYAAAIINSPSVLWGEIAQYSVYVHKERLYYALRDESAQFYNYSYRNAFVAKYCSQFSDDISKDLISLYLESNEAYSYSVYSPEAHKLSIIGMLAYSGEKDFVSSQKGNIIAILQDSIIPDINTYAKRKKWDSLPPDEKKYPYRDDNARKLANAEAGMWAVAYIADADYLNIIKEVMWYYNSNESIVYYATKAIVEIGDMRGISILQEFVNKFSSNDKEILEDCNTALKRLGAGNK